ncbi:MAG: (2Fe-2S)-binding protein [Pseudomonadota bacterium]
MYVCICNAVTDQHIRDQAAAGVDSLQELQARTGCGDCCGQCAEHAEAILGAAVQHHRYPVLPIPVVQAA